jgi:hypothetical protein
LNLNLLWSKKSAIVTITEAGEVLETGESQRTRTRIIRYVKTCGQISRNPMWTVTVRRSRVIKPIPKPKRTVTKRP